MRLKRNDLSDKCARLRLKIGNLIKNKKKQGNIHKVKIMGWFFMDGGGLL